ncbi:uncharacterized protein KIAA0895-like homolog isoform X3 [Canis lupus familiaris]|uniref:uncharacterized protein KIAA0895-like homolog isoform X3 n=1 Tax=Canis lupus familiaris TaxID=9615 RepID=UPI000BAA0A56|nr:uncharacterized protein KIAA0895-like homolog isoform X3 [Canis lupus familiaris]XP_038394622.1 uncharacterized protein KIAA0895-like homolog isoform X3 [Canis lupus familiaris]XP_038523333.1 uncharacterized protein KIAA0895-like homolog isoform X3 [Canis lupus familiaris]|eukprot:XP_022275076.1 uncharacterized protein KIAA0895-like homolog isoform X3 [Canis lupus familiaris]
MVLDSGAQVYEQAPPSPPASPSSLGHRLKPSDRDGTLLYPWPRSLALPLALSIPSALPPRPELQPFSELHLGHRGHMRRSESTYTVNSTGRRGGGPQGRAPPGRARDPGGGTLRSAASLPHIAKTRKDAGRGASKSPCMLVALRPTNMDRERDKFFQSHYTYNPQFEYQEPMPTAVLEKYCEASGQFIHQAVGIIEAVLEKFGTYEHFEAATGGQLLTKCQIWSIVRKYMQKEGCVGEVVVQLSEDLLSQAVMMVENSRPTLAINLTGARQYWLEGMLRHEIATYPLWLPENPVALGKRCFSAGVISMTVKMIWACRMWGWGGLHSLPAGREQRAAAVAQRGRPPAVRAAAREPHRGGLGQPAQRALPQAALSVARRPAVLHHPPCLAHVLPPALPGPGALRAGRGRALGVLRACQARPDRHLAARLLQQGSGVPGWHRAHFAAPPDHRLPVADLTGQGVL